MIPTYGYLSCWPGPMDLAGGVQHSGGRNLMYIPSALSKRECNTLSRYAWHRYVTEVGSLLGRSTIAMAKTAKHVVAIDRHSGYDNFPNDTERQLRRNLQVAGVEMRVDVVKTNAVLVCMYPADFTFIDLDGTYHTTMYTLQMAQSPLIGVHDYGRTGCRGVAAAVQVTGWRVRERVDSLVILEKPPSLLWQAPPGDTPGRYAKTTHTSSLYGREEA